MTIQLLQHGRYVTRLHCVALEEIGAFAKSIIGTPLPGWADFRECGQGFAPPAPQSDLSMVCTRVIVVPRQQFIDLGKKGEVRVKDVRGAKVLVQAVYEPRGADGKALGAVSQVYG